MLLTLEEFCGEEGVFEQPESADSSSSGAAGGAVFAPLFANLLQLLYDGEVVEEAAITNWAAEKEHADESEKVFLQKVGMLHVAAGWIWQASLSPVCVSFNSLTDGCVCSSLLK